jgi:hypothetical protein
LTTLEGSFIFKAAEIRSRKLSFHTHLTLAIFANIHQLKETVKVPTFTNRIKQISIVSWAI